MAKGEKMLVSRLTALCAALFITIPAFAGNVSTEPVLLIDQGPRNSEGGFVTRNDGSLLFAYTRFVEGMSDHAPAEIVVRSGAPDGSTWSGSDVPLVTNEGGFNVMSVSMLRLEDGRIALLYLRKNSHSDCRPYIRFSADDGKSWSVPVSCIERVGYYVVNNDRLIQLPSGRLLIPVAIHSQDGNEFKQYGKAAVVLSDDGGATWRWSDTILEGAADSTIGLQEPGVVAFPDGALWMYIRSDRGMQLASRSADGGVTWSPVEPTDLIGPVAPATVEPIPGTERLVAVWNDHKDSDGALQSRRTPLMIAVSDDRGETWQRLGTIEDDPDRWYAYTAIHFTRTHVLFAYATAAYVESGLGPIAVRMVRMPIDALTK